MDKKEYFDMLFNMGLFINPMLEYNDNILLQARKFDDEFMDLENFYDITKDIFYLNSLNENGKNKYEEFIEDEFYKKMNLNLDDEIDNKIKNIRIMEMNKLTIIKTIPEFWNNEYK